MLRMYSESRYELVSGFFWGSDRSISTNNPSPVGFEKELAREIAKRLTVKEVVVLGLGEMLATSLIVLAQHFESQVLSGQLKIIATNYEANGFHLALEENRRLNKNKRTVPDAQTLDFVSRHQEKITILDGVDTLEIKDALAGVGILGVDIVHESHGGLFHHPNQMGALSRLVKAMNNGGTLVTGTVIDRISKLGITPREQYSLDSMGYRFYDKL